MGQFCAFILFAEIRSASFEKCGWALFIEGNQKMLFLKFESRNAMTTKPNRLCRKKRFIFLLFRTL